jgi:hypothetical protein
MVEFQPSSWSHGSYLNVGASWLWEGQEHLSFDEGHRILEFVPFLDELQFTSEMREMATRARDEVLKLRERFPSVGAVAELLASKPDSKTWDSVHAGIAAGLVGKVDAARAHFLRLAAAAWDRDFTFSSRRSNGTWTERLVHVPEAEWHLDLKSRAKFLADIVADREAFVAQIATNVQVSRAAAKLPAIDAARCLVSEIERSRSWYTERVLGEPRVGGL